ncbi:hypothetical protein Hanom_Chr16g01488881 [Helianthus anomalus]
MLVSPKHFNGWNFQWWLWLIELYIDSNRTIICLNDGLFDGISCQHSSINLLAIQLQMRKNYNKTSL